MEHKAIIAEFIDYLGKKSFKKYCKNKFILANHVRKSFKIYLLNSQLSFIIHLSLT